MTMCEDDEVWERGVVVDYVRQIRHCFAAGVAGDGKRRRCWVRVVGEVADYLPAGFEKSVAAVASIGHQKS